MKLIPLSATSKATKHKGKYFAQVDDEDFDWLMQWNWSVEVNRWTKYAVRSSKKINGKRNVIKMHRFIMGVTDPIIEVDHKFGDGLDNKKINIRVATSSQQKHNTRSHKNSSSKHKGVSWNKEKRKWVPQICVNYKPIFLGRFDSELEAALAYDEAARKYHGEFANTNF